MTKYADRLWSDLVHEHGDTLAHTARTEPDHPGLLRRPRVLAGGTLGLAGVGAAVALVLGAAGGTSAAYAVSTNGDGSVLVSISQNSALPDANAKLASMGIHEQIGIDMAGGPAPVAGPVTCTPGEGVTNLPGPRIQVLVGTNGTEVIAPGTTGDNTGVGTWHLAACFVGPDSGNSGTAH